MGRLVVNMFVTLDGVMQAPGGPEEDPEGGFRHGGWQAPFMDDASGSVIMEGIERLDALLLGRKTYDIWVDHWPKAPGDDPIGSRFNAVPKYVASRTLKTVEWNNASLIDGELAAAVRDIKARHEEIHVWGSADLVQSLMRDGLVDRFVLLVYPVVLGTGKRLFPEGVEPTRFRLVESRPFEKGAVLMTLEPRGEPEYGDMARQEPPS